MHQAGKAKSANQWLETIGAALFGVGGAGYLHASIGRRTDTGYDESAGWSMLPAKRLFLLYMEPC